MKLTETSDASTQNPVPLTVMTAPAAPELADRLLITGPVTTENTMVVVVAVVLPLVPVMYGA